MQVKLIPHPTPKIQASELESFVKSFKEKTGEISLENISSICVMLMKKVQFFKGLNGPEKKQVVIDALNKFVEEHVDGQDEKNELKLLIMMTIPPLIDNYYGLATGKLKLDLSKMCGCLPFIKK